MLYYSPNKRRHTTSPFPGRRVLFVRLNPDEWEDAAKVKHGGMFTRDADGMDKKVAGVFERRMPEILRILDDVRAGRVLPLAISDPKNRGGAICINYSHNSTAVALAEEAFALHDVVVMQVPGYIVQWTAPKVRLRLCHFLKTRIFTASVWAATNGPLFTLPKVLRPNSISPSFVPLSPPLSECGAPRPTSLRLYMHLACNRICMCAVLAN